MTRSATMASNGTEEWVFPDARIPIHLERVNAPQAWARGYRGEGGSVAIVDSGIDNRDGAARRRLNDYPRREPLIFSKTWEPDRERYRAARVKYGGVFTQEAERLSKRDRKKYSFFDDYGHGTKMAGIVAARPGFDGVMGIAPRARVYNYKVTDEDGSIAPGALEEATRTIVEKQGRTGVRVVLFALDERAYRKRSKTRKRPKKPLKPLIKLLSDAGIVVVMAASDNPVYGKSLDGVAGFPGNYGLDNVLVVAAHDGACVGTEKLIRYSNWGKETVHLAACGRAVPSVAPTVPVAVFGTSASAAIVAGAAALIVGANPKLSAAALRSEVLKQCRPVPELAEKTITGGVLDLRGLRNA